MPSPVDSLLHLWSAGLVLGGKSFPWNIQGIVTLEYAPVWFAFGLGFERAHNTLVKLTPALKQVLGG